MADDQRQTLTDLRVLAEAATTGPWTCNEPFPRFITTAGEILIDEADWGQPDNCHAMQLVTAADSRAWRYSDVRYVAAVSPDVVVGLLDEITRLRATITDAAKSLYPLEVRRQAFAGCLAEGDPEQLAGWDDAIDHMGQELRRVQHFLVAAVPQHVAPEPKPDPKETDG